MKKNNGITLIALTVTIIVLIILASIATLALTGENGILAKASKAKEESAKAQAIEEIKLAVSEIRIDESSQNSTLTLDKLNTDLPTHLSGITSELANNEITGIYRNYSYTITSNFDLIIGSSYNTNGTTYTNIGTINVNVTITDIKSKSFTINVDPLENASKIKLYQYFVNDQLVYEGMQNTYTVTNLNYNTDYQVNVKAVPNQVVNLASVSTKTLDTVVLTISNLYDKYIYIDSVSGSDTTGDGTKEKPYKTLDKIGDAGIIQAGYSYGIILKSGTYQLNQKIFELSCTKSINIFGNKENTILQVAYLYPNSCGGSQNYTVNLYRLVWNGTTGATNGIFLRTKVNLYNVAFKFDFNDASYAYFIPYQLGYYFYNCTLGKTVTSLLRCDNGPINLTNCYGGYTSGYGTGDSSWNYRTNYLISSPQINTTTYAITQAESIWKNVGTGLDVDGSQADLGVYGGLYSWEYFTDLD